MTTKLKPTSTPWEVSQAGKNIYIYINVPSEHWPIHNVIANIDDDMGNAEANAAFILRAVNAHEELLNAMRKAVKDIESAMNARTFPPSSGIPMENAKIVLEIAIAKAEGK